MIRIGKILASNKVILQKKTFDALIVNPKTI